MSHDTPSPEINSFCSLYYEMLVWYHPSCVKNKNKLEVFHHKLLWVQVKDWDRIYPKSMLNTLGRATPEQFANYSTASAVLNAILTKRPERLLQMIEENKYPIRRTGKTKFYNTSRRRVGRQSIGNQLNDIFDQLCDNWTKASSKDAIRIYLKQSIWKQKRKNCQFVSFVYCLLIE